MTAENWDRGSIDTLLHQSSPTNTLLQLQKGTKPPCKNTMRELTKHVPACTGHSNMARRDLMASVMMPAQEQAVPP